MKLTIIGDRQENELIFVGGEQGVNIKGCGWKILPT